MYVKILLEMFILAHLSNMWSRSSVNLSSLCPGGQYA